MQSATGWSGTKGGLDMNKVITISRQYGSGGREVGQKLAEHYGIPFYDNELITRAAKESGFAEETFARAEDKATNSLLYSLAMGINVYGNQDFGFSGLSLDDRIFLAQSDVIRKVADDGHDEFVRPVRVDNGLNDLAVISVFVVVIVVDIQKLVNDVIKTGRQSLAHL